MNAVELLLSSARREGERLVVTLADAQTVAQRSAMRYDREGDDHYDIASALMKSMRGSDPDAALHYLARLLEAGDMTTAIRRILRSARPDRFGVSSTKAPYSLSPRTIPGTVMPA